MKCAAGANANSAVTHSFVAAKFVGSGNAGAAAGAEEVNNWINAQIAQ
jgi:hypothetical protein